jgi:hypothetical protein
MGAGLSLITAAIVHWNTVNLDRAVRQLRLQGTTVPDDLLARVASPASNPLASQQTSDRSQS